jgi:hypothetical protein
MSRHSEKSAIISLSVHAPFSSYRASRSSCISTGANCWRTKSARKKMTVFMYMSACKPLNRKSYKTKTKHTSRQEQTPNLAPLAINASNPCLYRRRRSRGHRRPLRPCRDCQYRGQSESEIGQTSCVGFRGLGLLGALPGGGGGSVQRLDQPLVLRRDCDGMAVQDPRRQDWHGDLQEG